MLTLEIPVEVDAETYAWMLEKYSTDQPREPAGSPEGGRFASVMGAGTQPKRPNEHKHGPVQIRDTKDRAFDGKPVPTRIRLTNAETDKITEAVVIQHLMAQGFQDAEVATRVRYPDGYEGGNHYAIDVYADHQAIELKGGNIANTLGAQQWRVKYGQESKAFTEWAKTADPNMVKAARGRMAAKCLKDKEVGRLWLEKARGIRAEALTYTAIINPDTRHVDLFRFEGYHLRLGWRQSEQHYVKSYRY